MPPPSGPPPPSCSLTNTSYAFTFSGGEAKLGPICGSKEYACRLTQGGSQFNLYTGIQRGSWQDKSSGSLVNIYASIVGNSTKAVEFPDNNKKIPPIPCTDYAACSTGGYPGYALYLFVNGVVAGVFGNADINDHTYQQCVPNNLDIPAYDFAAVASAYKIGGNNTFHFDDQISDRTCFTQLTITVETSLCD